MIHIEHSFRIMLQYKMRYGLYKMCLTKSGSAIKEKRIEIVLAWKISNSSTGGISMLVTFTYDKILKCILMVQIALFYCLIIISTVWKILLMILSDQNVSSSFYYKFRYFSSITDFYDGSFKISRIDERRKLS